MRTFSSSSIARKFVMSITGAFLILFIIFHLSMNLLLLFDDGTTYNLAAHFLESFPVIRVIELTLAAGFLIHIILGTLLGYKNYRARPKKYKVKHSKNTSSWTSRNMLLLGGFILTYLLIHLMNFFWKIKFGEVPQTMVNGEQINDTYNLVAGLFKQYWWYDVIYVLGAIFLGLHLLHGFWSAFQSIGLDNDTWRPRLQIISIIFAMIVAVGFASIPIYFFIVANF